LKDTQIYLNQYSVISSASVDTIDINHCWLKRHLLFNTEVRSRS